MRRSSKILLAGFGLSLLVLIAGRLNVYRLERHERELVATCEAGNHFDPATARPILPGEPAWAKDPFVCDPEALRAEFPPLPPGFRLDAPVRANAPRTA